MQKTLIYTLQSGSNNDKYNKFWKKIALIAV